MMAGHGWQDQDANGAGGGDEERRDNRIRVPQQAATRLRLPRNVNAIGLIVMAPYI